MRALGYVDDEKFARQRAGALAERGAGDRKIAHDLERHGVDRAVAESALAALEPELDRATRVVARRGEGRSTARLLASRGFSDDVIAAVVAPPGDWELG